MNREFIDAFNHLNVNHKRDKLNRELLVIGEYIKVIERNLGFENEIDLYNYNTKIDEDWSEDDFLTSTYQDIFNIERELITIAEITENDSEEMDDE